MRRSPLLISFVSLILRHPSVPSMRTTDGRFCTMLGKGILLAACVCSVIQVKTASAQTSENTVVADPYLVFVAEESTHLRCGPSGEYYRTDPVRHGQELEVYVETGDGWLGVRPTEDSFCWIPADTVKLLDSNDANHRGAIRERSADNGRVIEAEVIENKTVAWIGTNLGRARRYHWQVQLGEGEVATILGSSEREGPDGPQTWYRVVPPSGEFRWIHRDQVVTTAEELIATLKPKNSNRDIDFLPAGPSHASPRVARSNAVAKPERTQSQQIASTVAPTRAPSLRQVSDNQVWNESLDDIEDRIRARQRSRFERDDSDNNIAEQAQSLPPGPEVNNADVSSAEHLHDHHPRSFSQRVTEGLSSLMRGRKPNAVELEPITNSSRRVPELVPIGSGIEQTQLTESRSLVELPAQSNVVAMPQQNLPTPTIESPKVVDATAHPGFRSNQSQVAILSAPRMVTPANVAITQTQPSVEAVAIPTASPVVAATTAVVGQVETSPVLTSSDRLAASPQAAPGRHLPPQRTRTIQPSQLNEVRQSVANATAESLPLELSKLMSRGASAPEIALVAEAAERFGDRRLSIRARDYQSLARRRDGDTIVATAVMGVPVVSAPTIQPVSIPAAVPTNGSLGQFVPRSSIATTSFTPPVIQTQSGVQSQFAFPSHSTMPPPAIPTAAMTNSNGNQTGAIVEHHSNVSDSTGILVQVYSADPSRPPYAITDRGGRTIAYITPAPGVEVKSHLGSEVQITGESGYLQGLDTPPRPSDRCAEIDEITESD